MASNVKNANTDTNCNHDLSILYLSNGTESKLGSNLYVMLFYMDKSFPVLVDVGLIEATPSTTTAISGLIGAKTVDANNVSTLLTTNLTWLKGAEIGKKTYNVVIGGTNSGAEV